MKTASESDKVIIKNTVKVRSAPRQTSEMDPFATTFNRLELLTILADTYIKNAKPDVLQSPGFTSLLPLSWILIKTFPQYAHIESTSLFHLSSQQ